MRKLCTYLIIIFLVTVSFLFGPRDFPPAAIQKWGDFYIALNNHVGIRVEGDAFAFVSLAIKPKLLFENNQVRQSRPGYILAGHLVGTVIYAGTYPFRDQLELFFQSRIADKYPPKEKEKIARWFSFYTGYLLLNLVVLLVCFSIFESLVIALTGHWKLPAIRYLFLFLLIDNPITKLFFWSPHVQVFNILTPLLMLWLGLYLNKSPNNKLQLYAAAGLSGLLVLFYGSFLLLFPVLLFSYWKNSLNKSWPSSWKASIPVMVTTVLFALPVLTWMALINSQGGRFYSAEVGEFRQFIWVIDTLQQSAGAFFFALFTNTISFLNSMASLLVPAVFLSAIVIYLKQHSVNISLPVDAKSEIILVVISCLAFYGLLGYYADRLTFSFAAIMYLMAALYANKIIPARPFIVVLWTMAITWHLLLITGNPTYFGPTYFN